MRHPWWNWFILPAGILLSYFMFPVGGRDVGGMLLGALGVLAGLVAVVYVVIDESRRSEKRLRPIHLVILIELVVVIFASAYFGLATRGPGEFTGLATRLDALYFSMATVTTVGYGDISAVGQWARLLVTFQLAFDLAFVAVMAGMLQGRLRRLRSSAE